MLTRQYEDAVNEAQEQIENDDIERNQGFNILNVSWGELENLTQGKFVPFANNTRCDITSVWNELVYKIRDIYPNLTNTSPRIHGVSLVSDEIPILYHEINSFIHVFTAPRDALIPYLENSTISSIIRTRNTTNLNRYGIQIVSQCPNTPSDTINYGLWSFIPYNGNMKKYAFFVTQNEMKRFMYYNEISITDPVPSIPTLRLSSNNFDEMSFTDDLIDSIEEILGKRLFSKFNKIYEVERRSNMLRFLRELDSSMFNNFDPTEILKIIELNKFLCFTSD